MKTKEQLLKAEDIANSLNDYIMLVKCNSKLKKYELDELIDNIIFEIQEGVKLL